MPQTYQRVMRPELDSATAGDDIVTPQNHNPLDRTEIDELLADAEMSQQALAHRVGESVLCSTVLPRANRWTVMPLTDDDSFPRYSHDLGRWLEDYEK